MKSSLIYTTFFYFVCLAQGGEDECPVPPLEKTCQEYRHSLTPQQEQWLMEEYGLFREELILTQAPSLTDIWGYQMNWTVFEDGWYPLRRYRVLANELLLREFIRIHKADRKNMTVKGFEVRDIPEDLHKLIKENRDIPNMVPEDCDWTAMVINCKNRFEEGMITNDNTFLIPLKQDNITTVIKSIR